MDSLFLAVLEEHKARTGHDVFKQSNLSTINITCPVCLHLSTVKREFEKAEQDYYDRLRTENELESQ